jgi:hypothetical protein
MSCGPSARPRRTAVGFTTSSAEELQKKRPAARVVKAFDTVFVEDMDTGHLNACSRWARRSGSRWSGKGKDRGMGIQLLGTTFTVAVLVASVDRAGFAARVTPNGQAPDVECSSTRTGMDTIDGSRRFMTRFLEFINTASPTMAKEVVSPAAIFHVPGRPERGTHRGPFFCVAPTGKRITVQALNIYHLCHGQIVKEYGQPDMMALLQQIGGTPPSK